MKRLSIKLDEGRLSYFTDGQGPPLLLLHSLGVSSEAWNRVIKPLAQSYSVYTWDMMGHGDSDKPPYNFLIEDYARNVIEFSDRLPKWAMPGHAAEMKIASAAVAGSRTEA